jgi:ABC-type polysaccharide/polyol phosphate transport system ATPase subunit
MVILKNVTKNFPLYSTQLDQSLSNLGLGWLLSHRHRLLVGNKVALSGINLSVAQGEKVGVIGRNGSGKTTLLRLVIGHTQPTSGTICVDGAVQAMMQTGFAFDDELSGLENIYNSLLYNGLTYDQRKIAMADVVEFVELGEFLHHPIKIYSLGMRARLEFATATAVRPKILAIDEVLGAGDGYFVQKCASRMRRIISDSTLLLVSHSMKQVLDYCDRTVWLHDGEIMEDGPTGPVIKAYEHFMAEQEAQIQEQVRCDRASHPQGTDSFHAKQQPVVARSKSILENHVVEDEDLTHPQVLKAGFGPSLESMLITETGEPVDIRISCRFPENFRGWVEPVLYGFTDEGSFLFQSTSEPIFMEVTLETITTLRMWTEKFGVGIGNYFFSVALRRANEEILLTVLHACLLLRTLPTNHSDPPFLHLTGNWFSGSNQVPIETRISAWV